MATTNLDEVAHGTGLTNLQKLREGGCDLFIAASGTALMGVSEGEVEAGEKAGYDLVPDSAWVAGVICRDECDPERVAELAEVFILNDRDARSKEFDRKVRDTAGLTMMRLV
jgi:hypothetical protein